MINTFCCQLLRGSLLLMAFARRLESCFDILLIPPNKPHFTRLSAARQPSPSSANQKTGRETIPDGSMRKPVDRLKLRFVTVLGFGWFCRRFSFGFSRLGIRAVFFGFVVAGSPTGTGRRAVICGVKTRTFKDNSNRLIHFVQGFLPALGAPLQGLVAKFLGFFELHAAIRTPVSINRHSSLPFTCLNDLTQP